MHILSGLEVLLSERRSLISGRRVGLLANPTSVDRHLTHACSLLPAAGATLAAVFGPEHGVFGTAQDMIPVAAEDEQAALGVVPVYSLYGSSEETLAPQTAWLDGLDVVVVDLQDIGSRYYTYVWSMALMAKRCAEAGVAMVVCDRPNPLGGVVVEGVGIEAGYESFVGLHDVPARHGMTIGELARLYVAEAGLDVELTVVEAAGWRRELPFEATGLPWVLPSPNMPTVDTAVVYPGGCLLEGTNASEGRGTTRPFEIIGAPYIEGPQLAAALEAEGLGGVRFRPLCFQPTFQKHAGVVCGGVQLHVTDRRRFEPLRCGVAVVAQLARLGGERFAWREEAYEFVRDRPAIDLLAGGAWLREGVAAGSSTSELCAGFGPAAAAFRERRQPFLLYPEAGA